MGKILNKKTMKIFGYNTNILKPNSHKLVIWQCSICNIEKEKKYVSALKNNLCLLCSNKINANTNKELKSKKLKEWYKNNEHHLKDKHRSDEVKEKISKSKKGQTHSDETKKKISKSSKGENNPMYGHSVYSVWLEKHGEKEANIRYQKMIDKKRKNVKRGKNSNLYGKCHHGKGCWYINTNHKKIWMRSSWEIKYAKYLDENNIKWLYEPEAFSIRYNNKDGTYTPDFYLINENLYIEIKGYWRDDAKIKFNSFVEQYKNKNIEIYDKNKLTILKII